MKQVLKEHTKYLACIAAGLFSFYDLFLLSVFNVISSHLLQAFNLSTTQLGLFSACFLITNAIGLVVLGMVLDRYSVRKVGLIFLSLATLSVFGFALSTSLAIDVILRSIQGLASAASLLICMRSATSWFKKQSGFAVGSMIAIAVGGGILGNSVFAFLLHNFGWRNSLMISGIIGLALLSFMYLFLYDRRDFSKEPAFIEKAFSLLTLKTAFSNTQNIIAGLYLGLMSTPIFVLAALWGNYYLINTYHISSITAAGISSLFFIGMIVGSPCCGFIATNKTNPIKVMFLSCCFMLLLSILLFATKIELPVVSAVFFSLGFFSGAQNLAYSLIAETNPDKIASIATAVAAVILNGVGAITQFTFGWLLQIKTNQHEAGLILFPCAFGICFILIFALKRYAAKGSQEAVTS